jgi:hypothetical protein
MTREDAELLIRDARQRGLERWLNHPDDKPLPSQSWFEFDEIAAAIVAAVAEEREKWIRLAPWWTGRALQSPEDIRRLAVAEERDRCAAVVKSYQSPRSGILLARQPGVVIAQILEEIEVPGWQLEPPEKTELET